MLNKQYNIQFITFEQLKDFCTKQDKNLKTSDPYWESYPLSPKTCQEQFSVTHIYGLFKDMTLIGFFTIPSYRTTLLNVIYVLHEHRNKGICTHVLENYGIKELSCIKANVNALSIYQKLGFKEIQTNDPNIHSVKLSR